MEENILKLAHLLADNVSQYYHCENKEYDIYSDILTAIEKYEF